MFFENFMSPMFSGKFSISSLARCSSLVELANNKQHLFLSNAGPVVHVPEDFEAGTVLEEQLHAFHSQMSAFRDLERLLGCVLENFLSNDQLTND